MSLTLDGLKIFCDVVRQRSFSRGASLNNVTQSAASQAVSQIEKRLGVQLIDRSKRPFTLTPEGRVYYEGCRDLVDRYISVEERTRSLHSEAASSVTVASIYSVGLYDMNQYVLKFQAAFPRGQVRLQYLHPHRVYESVINGEADLGLVSFPRSIRGLQAIPWRDEPMLLICCPSHRLAHEVQINLAQLEGENFIAFDCNLDIRRNVDRSLREGDVEVHVNVVMEFDNIEAIKRAVEIGAGVSILPQPTVSREVENGSLKAIPLKENHLVRPMSIIYRKGRMISPSMKCFIDLLLQQDQEHVLDEGRAALSAVGVIGK